MSAKSIERTTRLHDLDLQYQQSRHKTDLISRDEDARRLQLRVLLLRDENTELQDKCAAKDAEIKALSQDSDELRVELDGIKTQNRPKDAQIKGTTVEATGSAVGHVQGHHHHNLLANKPKTETESCETGTQDLSTAIDDNIALTKELQQLRPEIELLRRQVANYEKMISEQPELQDHSGKELASKRQSKPEMLNGESKDVIELRAALDKATEKLAEGEKQRESMKSDRRKELEESERQKNKLEEKISTLEKKLKDSQRELHDLRKEFQVSRSNLKGDGPEDGNTHNQEATVIPRTKDRSPTTQKERLPRKNTTRTRATEQVMMGEKSTFSISPFLNKTKDYTVDTANETTGLGLTLDGVLAQVESDNPSPLRAANKFDTQSAMAPDVEQTTSTPPKPQEKLRLKSKKKAAIGDGSPMSNLTVSNQDIGHVKSEDTKDEEILKTILSKEAVPSKRIKLHETAIAGLGSEFEHKKRKRKLLNKTNNTILEEDETGEGTQPMETQPGRTRKLKSSVANAFSSQSNAKPFSPLKRHKRGVNASFLV